MECEISIAQSRLNAIEIDDQGLLSGKMAALDQMKTTLNVPIETLSLLPARAFTSGKDRETFG